MNHVAIVIFGEGYAFTVASVTTPYVPPPPPRRAKKRSGLEASFATVNLPSAVTSLYSTTTSAPKPYLGPSGEWPAACPQPPPVATSPCAAPSVNKCEGAIASLII